MSSATRTRFGATRGAAWVSDPSEGGAVDEKEPSGPPLGNAPLDVEGKSDDVGPGEGQDEDKPPG